MVGVSLVDPSYACMGRHTRCSVLRCCEYASVVGNEVGRNGNPSLGFDLLDICSCDENGIPLLWLIIDLPETPSPVFMPVSLLLIE